MSNPKVKSREKNPFIIAENTVKHQDTKLTKEVENFVLCILKTAKQ
jgi:hypothetical protein